MSASLWYMYAYPALPVYTVRFLLSSGAPDSKLASSLARTESNLFLNSPLGLPCPSMTSPAESRESLRPPWEEK